MRLNTMKNFIKNNPIIKKLQDETGMELIEWGILIVIVAALIGVAFTISSSLQSSMEDAGEQIQNAIEHKDGVSVDEVVIPTE